ncbi:hypothetical protein, partial [Phocaeicola sp.]|uniref:hypothetical protein n=1 Tax=Phocaeicola sp. TaxID=2773926 RepID=UPI003AB10D3F
MKPAMIITTAAIVPRILPLYLIRNASVKYYLKRYKMSERFQKQWDHFSSQLQERDSKTFGACDLELVALASKAAYRKGLGTALVTQFLSRARADGADTVRLLTNTLASW